MSGTPLCELRDASVRYGALYANRGVSLAVAPGEVVALVGENGAGKSTLLSALYGLVPLSGGEVRYAGQRVTAAPQRAIAAGIGLVHQHFVLLPSLTVAENVVFGWEPRRRGFLLDPEAAVAQVAALGARYGLLVDPRRRVAELTVGERQRVEILKILHRGARVLVLDEPTAVLTPGEAQHLLGVLRGLVDQQPRSGSGSRDQLGGAGDGAEPRRGMLLVTHKLDEVVQVADRVVVLRRGEVVAELRRGVDAFDEQVIARAMVGRDAAPLQRAPRPALDERAAGLEVQELTVARDGVTRLAGVSLSVRPGEIVGVAGVEGNGQVELCEALAGLRPATGRVRLGGRELSGLSLAARRAAGLGLVLEDRQGQGLVLDLSLEENLLLGPLAAFRRGPFGLLLDRRRLRERALALLAEYEVHPPEPLRLARALSGGNQQKLVVARELALTGARALVVAQPTRGVDIGAIEVIHRRLLAARDGGAAILLVSSELDELRVLSDRVVVLVRGRVVAQLDNPRERPLSREALGELMVGARPAAQVAPVAQAEARS